MSLHGLPAVVVFEALDILFLAALAQLYFYQDNRLFTMAGKPVFAGAGDQHVFTGIERPDAVVDGYLRFTADDYPVFAALLVALQAESLSRLYHDALYLVTRLFQ